MRSSRRCDEPPLRSFDGADQDNHIARRRRVGAAVAKARRNPGVTPSRSRHWRRSTKPSAPAPISFSPTTCRRPTSVTRCGVAGRAKVDFRGVTLERIADPAGTGALCVCRALPFRSAIDISLTSSRPTELPRDFADAIADVQRLAPLGRRFEFFPTIGSTNVAQPGVR